MSKYSDYLFNKGIVILEQKKNNAGIQAKINCPKCGKPECYINLDTGVFQCWRKDKCGVQGSFTKFRELRGDVNEIITREKKYNIPEKKLADINSEVNDFFNKRGVKPETVKQFPIAYIDGSIVFIHKRNGNVIDYKYRKINSKEFWGEKDCEAILWNQDNVKGDTLYITEGHCDCVALAEYGYIGVSIPSGVANLNWIENDWDFLQRFKKIYIIMDSDSAGRLASQKIANRLGLYRCYNVNLPYKDVNDCLLNFLTKEQFNEYIIGAEEFTMNEIKHCDYYTDALLELIHNKDILNGTICGCAELTKILKGWRPAEVTVWTGFNGSGKSTFILQEMVHLLQKEKKVCIGSFELKPQKFLYTALRQDANKMYEKLSGYDVELFMNKYPEQLYIVDITGNIEEKKLYDVIEFSCMKYGVEFFIIDGISNITFPGGDVNEFADQKRFIGELKKVADRFNIHIHLVTHPRKPKDGEQIVNKYDVKGNSAVTDLVDNVVCVTRVTEEQKKKAKELGKPEYEEIIEIQKNREHGDLGKIGFYFNKYTRRFETEPIVYIDNNKPANYYDKD